MFGKLKDLDKKHLLVLGVFTIIFLFFSLNIYNKFIRQGVAVPFNEHLTTTTKVMEAGDEFVQQLELMQDNLCELDLYFATYGKSDKGSGEICLKLVDRDTKEVLAESALLVQKVYDGMKYQFRFPKIDITQRKINLVIEVSDIEDATVSLYMAETGAELKEALLCNGSSLSSPLRLDYRYRTFSYTEYLIVFSLAVLFVFFIGIYYLIFKKKSRIHRIYLVAVLVLGMLYMMLIPAFTTPDECSHLYKALEVSNVLMGYDLSPEHFELRECEAEIYSLDYEYTDLKRETYEYYYGNLLHGSNASNMTSVEYDTIKTPQYQYFLSGMGITLGRLLNLNAFMTLSLGMLFNFVFYVAVTALAVKWIPFGKVTTAIICLLPISMQQATSYSYDALVIPLGILFTACMLRVLCEQQKDRMTLVVLALSAILFLPTKQLAYLPLGVLLIYGFFKVRKKDRRLAWKLLAIMAGCIAFILLTQVMVNRQLAEAATESTSGPYIEWADQPGYSIGDLLASPIDTMDMIWNTLYVKGDFYFKTTFGGILSWMSVHVSVIAVLTYFVASVLSVMPKKNERVYVEGGTRVLFFILFFVSLMCIVGGMLLGWTPVSLEYVEGVQGRYFLPVLLLGIIAFRGKEIMISEKLERTCLMAALMMQSFTIVGILNAF